MAARRSHEVSTRERGLAVAAKQSGAPRALNHFTPHSGCTKRKPSLLQAHMSVTSVNEGATSEATLRERRAVTISA
jgi:hypothetical protein